MLKNALSSILAVAALGLGFSFNAGATVTAGESSAYGEFVDLIVTPHLGVAASVTSGPVPTVSGTAPAPYDLTNSALSASVPPFLSTGLLTVNASSDVDSLSGSRNTSADATVNDLSVDLSVLLSSLGIGLTATSVQSTAAVSGDFGAFSGVGTTTFEGLTLNGVASILSTPAPNTVLLDLPGLTVTLNEQIINDNLPGSYGMEVNAVHVSFDDFLAPNLSLVSGDVILSHSQAMMMGVVPEPESFAMLLAGLGLMGAVIRRRSTNRSI